MAALLALFLGGLGAHHFYLGRPVLGVLYLLFCWTFIPAIIAFIEGIVLLVTSDDNFHASNSARFVSGGMASSGSIRQQSGGNGCVVAIVICGIVAVVGFVVLQAMINDHNQRRQAAIDFHRGEAERALRDTERMLDELRRR